jgi:hypothetical protein
MKQFLLSFSLAATLLSACISTGDKSTPKAVGTVNQDSIEQVAIAKTIHDFYTWYNAFDQSKDNPGFDFIGDKGKHHTLIAPKLDAYIARFTATGLVSSKWADSERAFFQKCEKQWQKEILGDLPFGLDVNRVYCAQDGEFDEFKTAMVKSVITGNQAAATMQFQKDSPNGEDRNYSLEKENGKWLISNIDCPMGDVASNPDVPTELFVTINEAGKITFEDKVVKYDDLKKVLTAKLSAMKKLGISPLPTFKIKMEGTVLMGIRHDMQDIFTEVEKKF